MLSKKHFQILAKAFGNQFNYSETLKKDFVDKLEFFMDILEKTNSQFDREIFRDFVYKSL